MSHFAVMVIGDDVEQQLAPFQENNMGDCPREYLEFEDHEDEWRAEYENNSTEMIKLKDGTLEYPWSDKFKVGQFPDQKTVIPDTAQTVQVPYKDRYATFEVYAAEWHGQEKRDATKNRYGYWRNPNTKWDWYVIGGRWTGYFKLKPGAAGDVGRPGIMTAPAEEGHADSVLKRDVDFEGLRSAAGEKAMALYDKVHAIVAGREIPDWDAIRTRHGDNIDAARSEFHNHPVMKDLHCAKDKELAWVEISSFRCTRDEYVQRCRNSAVTPFAVLKDGKWVERGEMGWWAIVHNDKDQDAWDAEFTKVLDELPDDTRLTIVDCHI